MSAKALSSIQALYAAVAGGMEDTVDEEGLRALLQPLRENFRTLVVEPTEMIDAGTAILVTVRTGGRGKSGAEAWSMGFHVHTIVDDRPVRIAAFHDLAAARRAAGLDDSPAADQI